jgi:TRAP-type C4-dicarboxylate transport system substrate-binding protein
MIRLPCRTLLASAAARPLFAIRSRPADAAEFTYKYANNSPMTHPLTVRTTEAAARVKGKTGGRVEIQVFPNNQLARTPTC